MIKAFLRRLKNCIKLKSDELEACGIFILFSAVN
jgi:hypothetical protein